MTRDRFLQATRPSPGRGRKHEATAIDDFTRSSSNMIRQKGVGAFKDEDESSNIIQQKVIVVKSKILSVVLLADGLRLLSGDSDGKIRCWQVEDGEEVGTPIVTESAVHCLAASPDGKWIVAGTESGRMHLWDAETRQEVDGSGTVDTGPMNSVDISSDGTKVAMALDGTVMVRARETPDLNWWDLPWVRVDFDFHVVKFSPDGSLLAIGAERWGPSSLSIYCIEDDEFLVGVQISARSVVWTSDSKQLFVLSSDSDIHRVDAYSADTLAKWPIHSNVNPTCISLSSDGAFIAASANASVSFWDTTTCKQIGSVVHFHRSVQSVAISQSCDLVIAGDSIIVVLDLFNILPTLNDQKWTAKLQTPGAVLKGTISDLRRQLADAQQKEDAQEKFITSLRADYTVQNMKSVELEKTIKALHTNFDSTQQKHSREIKDLEASIQRLRIQLSDSQQVIRAYRQKHQCETLFADGRIIDAAKSLLDIIEFVNDDIKSDETFLNWLSDFVNKCIASLERIGNVASLAGKDDEAVAAYVTALSLRPSSPNTFLKERIGIMLLHNPISEVLDTLRQLNLPKIGIYCVTCDVLEERGRVAEAMEHFQDIQRTLAQAIDVGNKRMEWKRDFQRRCAKRLKTLADAASASQDYIVADEYYSTVLSLDPPNCMNILFKRSETRVQMKEWEDVLWDADKMVELDPSSHLGHEQRHAALLRLNRHEEAAAAYDTMLSKLKEYPDTCIRGLRSPHANVISTIRGIIHETISPMPRILIDTTTGRLNDKVQLLKAFEVLPIFNKFMSSMANEMDSARIRSEVKKFYRYVMLSHKWEHNEPLFSHVNHVTVYELDASRANIKLRKFCELVRSLGFRWAWSDTCCIDKDNNVVQQESLIAMFAWYRGSSLTIIHLCDVSSEEEEPDGIRWSIWNSRVWTFQEYVASQRVLFYTKDWKPYLGLTLENHKDSPIIRREMEMSQVSSEQVAVLQPGLNNVREKLYLASMREATLVEDIAYSLFGIFSTPIPVMYGEGTRAVGRLLEYVLTGSGDTTILAWTGTANDHNSCLPVNLSVYNTVLPPHVPLMEIAELDHKVAELRSSLPDLPLITTLYNELNELPSPTITYKRLKLPGIVSNVNSISTSGPDVQTYRATTDLLGAIDIKTASNLGTMKGQLCLVHPWIRPLLDQEFARGSTKLDSTTQALQLVARLRQPFGALLFEQVSRTEYRRVAADSLIMAQFRKDVVLSDLMSNIRTIEVL